MAISDFLTLSMDNLFSFTCPVFAADVEIRSCVVLRNKVYAGEHVQTRRGCQACIRANKCPAAELVSSMAHGRSEATDHCSSLEPVKGRLPAYALERIQRVMVLESHLRMADVPSGEVDAIATANERIAAQLETAPMKKVEARRVATSSATSRRTVRRPAASPATTTPETVKTVSTVAAAASGDLSAAINQ